MATERTVLALRRGAIRVHRWIALVVGIQILLWISGGVVMSVLPIEDVRSEHKVRAVERMPLDPRGIIDLAQAAETAGLAELETARLGWLASEPVWRLSGGDDSRRVVVDARDGRVLSPFDAVAAERLARADVTLDAAVVSVTAVADEPDEYGGPLPAWRVDFADGDSTSIYVDALDGRITARRSTTWRFYDLFWRLHVMDYDDGADFNHPLIIAASSVALLVALSGLLLLYARMRQSLLTTLAVRRRRASSGGAG